MPYVFSQSRNGCDHTAMVESISSGRIRSGCAAFGRSRAGVQFQSLDGKPAHLIFAIVAPEQSAGMHLKALARISRLLKDDRFRRSLLEAGDADDLRRVFREYDDRG